MWLYQSSILYVVSKQASNLAFLDNYSTPYRFMEKPAASNIPNGQQLLFGLSVCVRNQVYNKSIGLI